MNGMPSNELRPMPNSVRASPDATWFARNMSVSTPNNIDIMTPATAPATIPSAQLPVVNVAINAHTAPTSIMPSTPRFKTPDFSATSSPVAASSSGVAALTTVSRINSIVVIDPIMLNLSIHPIART